MLPSKEAQQDPRARGRKTSPEAEPVLPTRAEGGTHTQLWRRVISKY